MSNLRLSYLPEVGGGGGGDICTGHPPHPKKWGDTSPHPPPPPPGFTPVHWMMVVLICLPFSLIFMSLLFIAFHSSRLFSIPFFKITATSSEWWLSSLPKYRTVSPVFCTHIYVLIWIALNLWDTVGMMYAVLSQYDIGVMWNPWNGKWNRLK